MADTHQEEQMLTFVCWNCERGISVSAEASGRRGRCPSCRAPQRVPGGPELPKLPKHRSRRRRLTPTRAVVARSRQPAPRPLRRRVRRRGRDDGPLPWFLGGLLLALLILWVGLAS